MTQFRSPSLLKHFCNDLTFKYPEYNKWSRSNSLANTIIVVTGIFQCKLNYLLYIINSNSSGVTNERLMICCVDCVTRQNNMKTKTRSYYYLTPRYSLIHTHTKGCNHTEKLSNMRKYSYKYIKIIYINIKSTWFYY